MRKSGRRSSAPRPTTAELRILQYLWSNGSATVREVHNGLFDPAEVGYTTVLKLMQIMHDKGLLERDSSQRAHVYQPARDREHTQAELLQDFVSRVYQGSATKLVLQALGTTQPASSEELDEIRAMLDALDLGGAVRTVASHLALTAVEDDLFRFEIHPDHAVFVTDRFREDLARALTAHQGREIAIRISTREDLAEQAVDDLEEIEDLDRHEDQEIRGLDGHITVWTLR